MYELNPKAKNNRYTSVQCTILFSKLLESQSTNIIQFHVAFDDIKKLKIQFEDQSVREYERVECNKACSIHVQLSWETRNGFDEKKKVKTVQLAELFMIMFCANWKFLKW